MRSVALATLLIFAVANLSIVNSSLWTSDSASQVIIDNDAKVLERGKVVFEQNCAGCHGMEGHGNGAAAPYLHPKPRDFSSGTFKLTSTSQGSLPTDDDLFRSITDGMPGSAMPSWELLTEADRKATAQYVKTLVRYFDEDENKWVNRYDNEGELTPVAVPPAPASSSERIALGKLVYRRADCWKCHGDDGRGDGIQSSALRDQWGYEIRPRDFTAGYFKGGNNPEDLYKRVSIGVNGTPMPSHEQSLSVDDRWNVALYVLSLARPSAQAMTQQKRRPIVAERVNVSADWLDPASTAWKERKATYLALMPLWWRQHRVEGILVKSVHDSKSLYLHVTWEDATSNTSALQADGFRDALAVQWARSDSAPFIAMGAGAEDVNIWMWKADREGPVGTRAEVHTEYPNVCVMDYPEMNDWKPAEEGASSRAFSLLGPRFASGWAAGNPVSDPNVNTAVENLAAHGFSTLSPIQGALRRVKSQAVFDHGVWNVVLSRQLTSSDPSEVQLTPGKTIPAAFAVFEGSAHDRNGQKSITIWHDFTISQK